MKVKKVFIRRADNWDAYRRRLYKLQSEDRADFLTRKIEPQKGFLYRNSSRENQVLLEKIVQDMVDILRVKEGVSDKAIK